jgi:hypothetical protein
LLAMIGESMGYEPVAIDLFRTRLATATRERLREEVVVLRWPGLGRSRWEVAVNRLLSISDSGTSVGKVDVIGCRRSDLNGR